MEEEVLVNKSTSSSPVSRFAHLYLGEAGVDPTPVFRDLSPDALPDGTAWREGSVFAVSFPKEQFPLAAKFDESSVVGDWEFYNEQGWPVDLPSFRQEQLGDVFKTELQVYPWGWRTASDHEWYTAEHYPDHWCNGRVQATVIRSLASFAPPSLLVA